MNTDKRSQYTAAGWIKTLTGADIKISIDGRGRYLDNIFIERLRRSLKQEAVYLHEITNGFPEKRIIDTGLGSTTQNALTRHLISALRTLILRPGGDTKSGMNTHQMYLRQPAKLS